MKTLKLFSKCSLISWIMIYVLLSLMFGDFTTLIDSKIWNEYTIFAFILSFITLETFILILIWPLTNKTINDEKLP